MKSLQHHLTEYVAARRALGTQLEEPAQTLRQFVRFLARRKTRFITIQLALEWSQQSPDVQRATWARKLSMVRQFARWMSVIDPRHQVPPRRLLAATGLRPGEAAALERSDVDLEAQLLTIRKSKFGKSRLVPIHPSTVEALKRYALERDRIFHHSGDSCFLVSERGTTLDLGAVRRWLCKISRACGLRTKAKVHRCGRGPRLQDLRHTFATRRLVEWYQAGCDVAVQMPKLATYLGHSSVGCTYWYIEAVPELLQLATEFQLGSRQGGQK